MVSSPMVFSPMVSSIVSSSRRWWGFAALAALPLAVLGVFFLLPVGGMIARGFWPDGSFDPGAVTDVFGRPRTLRVLWFTLLSAGAGTLLSLVLGLPAAYVTHRLDLPWMPALRAALLAPFVLPTVVVGVAFRQLLSEGGALGGLGLDGSPVAIVAALAFFNIAVVVRSVGATWEGLDPRPAEAAAVMGARPLQVFWTVTWPGLRRSVAATGSVVFLFCATAFGVVLTLGGLKYATVETEIYLLTTNLLDLPAASALSLLQLLVVIGLLLASRRLEASGPRRRVELSPLRRPSRSDLPALVVTGLAVALVAAPIVTLVLGSLRVDGSWGLAHYRALASPVVQTQSSVWAALVNSLRIATDATWMSIVLGLSVALLVTRRVRSRGEQVVQRGMDGLFLLPLGVSAVTLGFGFLITLGRPPFALRDSPLLIPIAQALVALPLVVRTLTPVLAAIDDRQRQAAATLGASPLRSLLVVEWPALRRPLLAAAGFAFAVSLGEFGATSFLSREDRPTLPVLIYALISHPGEQNFGAALAASCVLAALTAAVMALVDRVGVRSVGAW